MNTQGNDWTEKTPYNMATAEVDPICQEYFTFNRGRIYIHVDITALKTSLILIIFRPPHWHIVFQHRCRTAWIGYPIHREVIWFIDRQILWKWQLSQSEVLFNEVDILACYGSHGAHSLNIDLTRLRHGFIGKSVCYLGCNQYSVP